MRHSGLRGSDSLPEWSTLVDSSSTSESCVGSHPTAVIVQQKLATPRDKAQCCFFVAVWLRGCVAVSLCLCVCVPVCLCACVGMRADACIYSPARALLNQPAYPTVRANAMNRQRSADI